MLTFKSYLIACPLLFLAGFVDSIAGGGGLISLPAYMFAGLPVKSAIASNKMSSSCGTTIAAYKYIKNKCVDFYLVIPCIILSLTGSHFGSKALQLLDENVFKKIMLFILPVITFVVVFKKESDSEKQNYPRFKQLVICCLISLVIGMYDGFYSPGTGTFLIIGFTLLAKVDSVIANGNSKLVNLASNVGALTNYLMSGYIVFALALPGALCNMAGAYVGSNLAIKKGKNLVKAVTLVVIGLLFVKVLSEVI